MIVIPTVLAYNKEDFKSLWDKVTPLADEIQVDIMDGRFVETTSLSIEALPDVRKLDKKFEAHMMMKEPVSWILPLIDKGYKRLIIHYEAIMDEDVSMITEFVKKNGGEWCLAINPDTPINKIIPHTEHVKDILVMGVHPGINGAPYVEETPRRVKELHEKAPDVTIQVDGGITDKTIAGVVQAGATRINSGSYIGGSDNPKAALQKLYEVAE